MLNIGNAVTKSTIDNVVGTLAARLNTSMNKSRQVVNWLADIQDSDLEGLGYTADDITGLRAAIGSMGTLHDIYVGDATLDPAVDFRTTIRKIAGLGD